MLGKIHIVLYNMVMDANLFVLVVHLVVLICAIIAGIEFIRFLRRH